MSHLVDVHLVSQGMLYDLAFLLLPQLYLMSHRTHVHQLLVDHTASVVLSVGMLYAPVFLAVWVLHPLVGRSVW